jgi:hypothetical protein
VVDLTSSLIGTEFRITTPVYGGESGMDDIEKSRSRADYLSALWRSWRYVGQKDAFAEIRHSLIVLGRAAVQTAWIKTTTPETMRWYRPPVLFRVLDPRNVGYLHDDVGLSCAYNTYSEKAGRLLLRYPEAKKIAYLKDKDRNESVSFTDFWYLDNQGAVWNCYLLDKMHWLRKPRRSEVPIIPIAIRNAHGSHASSIIDSVMEEWSHENSLESMVMTGVSKTFWPALLVADERGEPIPDLDTSPGAINEVSSTLKFVDVPKITPDFQSANGAMANVKQRIQRGTFPDSVYGQASASQRSGFMQQTQFSAGAARINLLAAAIKHIMTECNSLALCMVKKFEPESTTLYAYDDQDGEMVSHSLSPDDIGDTFENHVELIMEPNPGEALQKIAVLNQLVAAQVISPDTVRDQLPFKVPRNELERILAWMALKDPDILKARIAEAYLQYYGQPLPQGEPDMQMTPQAQPMGQPEQAFPGMALPPQAQGQMTPEDMGNSQMPPEMFAALMGGQGGQMV